VICLIVSERGHAEEVRCRLSGEDEEAGGKLSVTEEASRGETWRVR